MDLSVIIVNYNVCHFLEQAISTSLKAITGLQAEIIVVDNNSIDQSCEMVNKLFPEVILIRNKENYGFAKANNIGIKIAKGEFVLLLNPDTLVQEDCFQKCIEFMRSNPKVGALGVKMLDGSGNILPESKRGFPTTWVSFCKMSGLYKLFPHSKLFNGYYLGHLDYTHNHRVEILTGAFFFTRKKILEQLNGLDESYFMYGEDIDLSHSVNLLGYELHYLAETQIIHFKGESTKKSSLNYWSAFYNAMLIFTNKYHQSNSGIYLFLLKIVILFKGVISFIRNFLNRSVVIIFDAMIILLGSYFIKNVFSVFFYNNPYHFQSFAIWINMILYTLIWIISFYLNGLYDKKYRIQDIVISTVIGFMINLSIYALMPESLRSSRLLLGLIFLWVLAYVFIGRFIFNRIFGHGWKFSNEQSKSIIIVGDEQEESFVKNMLLTNKIEHRIVTRINSSAKSLDLNWSDVARLYKPDEIIFCPSINSVHYILKIIGQLPEFIQIKILNPSGSGIIGSSDSKAVGELYTFEFSYNLQKEKYQRQKRFFDIAFSFLVLIFTWLLIFIYKDKIKFLSNTFNVLFGFKTWVALGNLGNETYPNLINKPGILEPLNLQQKYQGKELVMEVYKNYLWNYSMWMDMDICLRDINQLDH
ncbi:MAG: glycosyltransferase [Saprospiraceae bacterium]